MSYSYNIGKWELFERRITRLWEVDKHLRQRKKSISQKRGSRLHARKAFHFYTEQLKLMFWDLMLVINS
ncbi:MAG: hypothetical protein ABJA76_01025 [Mucilaginibacter sp.]